MTTLLSTTNSASPITPTHLPSPMTATTDHGNVDSTTVANDSIEDATDDAVDEDHTEPDDNDVITATFEWQHLHTFAPHPRHRYST